MCLTTRLECHSRDCETLPSTIFQFDFSNRKLLSCLTITFSFHLWWCTCCTYMLFWNFNNFISVCDFQWGLGKVKYLPGYSISSVYKYIPRIENEVRDVLELYLLQTSKLIFSVLNAIMKIVWMWCVTLFARKTVCEEFTCISTKTAVSFVYQDESCSRTGFRLMSRAFSTWYEYSVPQFRSKLLAEESKSPIYKTHVRPV